MDFPKTAPSVGLMNGRFVDEDLLAGKPGSLIVAQWANQVTDEILAVIKDAGLTPKETDSTQLLRSIKLILGKNVVSVTGTGALTGGGKLDSNRTIDASEATKASLIRANTAVQPDEVGYKSAITVPLATKIKDLVAGVNYEIPGSHPDLPIVGNGSLLVLGGGSNDVRKSFLLQSYGAGRLFFSAVKIDGDLSEWTEVYSTGSFGILQSVGVSTKDVMSQKAATDALNAKANSSVTVTGIGALSGGGNLTVNRTIDLSAASKASLSRANTAVQPESVGFRGAIPIAISQRFISLTPGVNYFVPGSHQDLPMTGNGSVFVTGGDAGDGRKTFTCHLYGENRAFVTSTNTEGTALLPWKEVTPNAKNTASKAVAGWWKCGETGVITQWGECEHGVTSSFPIVFPNALGSLVVTKRNASNASQSVSEITRSSFWVEFGGGGGKGYYLAHGW